MLRGTPKLPPDNLDVVCRTLYFLLVKAVKRVVTLLPIVIDWVPRSLLYHRLKGRTTYVPRIAGMTVASNSTEFFFFFFSILDL
jgi:hypothetical protein